MSKQANPPANQAPNPDDFGPKLDAANALIRELQEKLNVSEEKSKALEATVADLQNSLRTQVAQVVTHPLAGQGTHLSIASAHPAGKHMRAGREWLRTHSVVHKDDFSAEQIKQLKSDPMLVVVDL